MNFISLFSGAMGLDLGLEQCGFNPLVCVENNSAAVKTIKANRPKIKVFENSITEFNYRYSDDSDAQVFAGIQLSEGLEEKSKLVKNLRQKKYPVQDLTDNESERRFIESRLNETDASDPSS